MQLMSNVEPMLTWYSLAIAFCVAFAMAFVLAWHIEDESKAYSRAFCTGLVLVFMSVIGDVLLASGPSESNEAATGFFFLVIPVTLGWLVAGAIAFGFARVVRWQK